MQMRHSKCECSQPCYEGDTSSSDANALGYDSDAARQRMRSATIVMRLRQCMPLAMIVCGTSENALRNDGDATVSANASGYDGDGTVSKCPRYDSMRPSANAVL